FVEACAQLVCLPVEPVGEVSLAPDLPRELRHPALRVVDVALRLDRGDRWLRERPVRVALRVPRVLPGLIGEARLAAPLVLDEPVPVAVAILVDPGERPQRGLLEAAYESRVVRPAPDLGEQDQVERR